MQLSRIADPTPFISSDPRPFPRSWPRKFRDAFRGTVLGVRGQRSFPVHFAFAVAVIGCGWGFRVGLLEWLVLLLCITAVLTAEMFNSAWNRWPRR